MNDVLSTMLLLLIPGVPLLLAFPALHSRLPRPCHLALLPAVILLAVPGVSSIELPWLLFGIGLGVGEGSRWLLAMSVLLWATAAGLLHRQTGEAADNRTTVFFLLTMACNLGAILATDLVGFFAFSSLMGYGFYGLLVGAGDETARRVGRIYLGFQILADLALFEALLIASATIGDLGFEAVRQAMALAPSSDLYLSMVVLGFAAKAGVWPLHLWLSRAFRSSRAVVALMLGGVPVAIGMLGAVRWLPLGEIAWPGPGLLIQILGVAAILYAALAGLIRAQWKMLPVCAAIIATGIFTTAVGAGLRDPDEWSRYGNQAYLFIVIIGIVLALLTVATDWLRAKYPYADALANQPDESVPWLERWSGIVVRWAGRAGFEILPQWRASWLANVSRLRQIHAWQRSLDASERSLQRWTFVITLFLLLGMVVFVGASSWLG